MKFHNKLRIIAITLVLAGLIGILPLGYFKFQNKVALAQNNTTVPVSPAAVKHSANFVSGQPVEIAIPSLKMDLQVIPGVYNMHSGEWTLTLDKAQFAEPSFQPNNEAGNTLIYGHYRPEVFAYLHLIKPGAQAIVTTANGYAFTYTYQSSDPLDPTDTSIFSYTGAPRLTIQTCSGSYMQHRQMYYFKYDGFTKL